MHEMLLNEPFGMRNSLTLGDPVPKLFTAYTCKDTNSIYVIILQHEHV